MKKYFIFILVILTFIQTNISFGNEIPTKIDYKIVHSADSNGILIVQRNNKYGLYTSQNTEVLPTVYDYIEYGYAGPPTYITKTNNKYGYVDKYGKVLIPEEYDALRTIAKFGILVKKDGKYGLFSPTGINILKTEYDDIYTLTNSLTFERYLVLRKNDKYALYDRKTRKQTKFIYDRIYQNFANEATGFINGKKQLIHPVKSIINGTTIVLCFPIALVLSCIAFPLAIIALITAG